jgi:hypothetical protein
MLYSNNKRNTGLKKIGAILLLPLIGDSRD